MDNKDVFYFLEQAIFLAKENAEKGLGPFGCLIVRTSEIVSEGVNTVTRDNDPSAHAEINAIRNAGKILGSFDLSGCTLFSSSFPCPMCFSAMYWAHINEFYYANEKEVARKFGFDDVQITDEMCSPSSKRRTVGRCISIQNSQQPFIIWKDNPNKVIY